MAMVHNIFAPSERQRVVWVFMQPRLEDPKNKMLEYVYEYFCTTTE